MLKEKTRNPKTDDPYKNETYEQYAQRLSNEKLISEIIMLDNMIYEIQCYGTRDMTMLQALSVEADRRGIDAFPLENIFE